ARCGVLHTSSAESRLGQEGRAQEVWYRFKGRIGVNLMTNTPRQAVLVDVEVLISASERASGVFLAELEHDQSRIAIAGCVAKRCRRHAAMLDRSCLSLSGRRSSSGGTLHQRSFSVPSAGIFDTPFPIARSENCWSKEAWTSTIRRSGDGFNTMHRNSRRG